jgi:hypothetical protein
LVIHLPFSLVIATDDDNPRRAVELAIAKSAISLITDGSAMVRDELVGCLAQLVFSQQVSKLLL